MSDKIPTAEEFHEKFFNNIPKEELSDCQLIIMIEFAKLHVKAQKEAIISKLKKIGADLDEIDWNSILNAYPLNLIQ